MQPRLRLPAPPAPTADPDRASGAAGGARGASLWLVAALVVAVGATVLDRLDVLCPARAGEPAALRWLRACCQHPLRSSLALVLFSLALRWPSHAPSQRSEQEL